MSKQAQQRIRMELYLELREIVGAMKNMAEVELHRAIRLEQHQKQALATVLEGMGLLLKSAPTLATPSATPRSVLLVLGSERGFCGGFNEQLVRALEAEPAFFDEVLIMGGRLAAKLGEEKHGTFLPGPTTVDEILPRLQQAMDHLSHTSLPLQCSVLSHGEHGHTTQQLLPCLDIPNTSPVVHVDTTCKQALLFEAMQWQLLYQGLFRTMLVSLLRENRMRLQQMEGAREHLETLINALHLRLNTLRQQEIVEEIEMILVGLDTQQSPL